MRKKMIRHIALTATALLFALASVVSVFGAVETINTYSEESLDSLLSSTEEFIDTVMVMNDSELSELSEYGFFYENTSNAISDVRDDLGAYIQITSSEIEQDDAEITMTFTVECENLDAEIIVTFDAEESQALNFTVNPQYPVSVSIANAARNTITGLCVVFVILAFLIFVISLFKKINPDLKKAAGVKTETESAQVKKDDVISPASVSCSDGNDELIAVIAAAIAAAREEGSSSSNYIVKSVRKTGSSKRWKRV